MENNVSKIAACLALFLVLLLAASNACAKTAYLAEVNGNIDAGTYQYLKRVLDTAKSEKVDLVILKIDVSGGYIKPMRGINEEIVNSRGQVKVASYVSKKFKGAFSAGAYVLMASPIAAVDPQGYIGSAQPLSRDNTTIYPMADYMAGLADINHRNISFSRFLVTNNTFVDGKKAKDLGLVEYTPESVSELMTDLNDSDADLIMFSPTMDEMLLSFFSNPPTISFLLLTGCLASVYIARTRNIRLALIPLVSFAIVFWGVTSMEFSLLGIGLIVFGVCLVSAEMFSTRPTIFGIAGGLSVAVGTIISDSEPFFTPGLEATIVTLVLSGILIFASVFIANRFGRLHLESSRAGTEALIKEKGRVVEELRPNGIIKIHGKLRQAYSFAEEKIEMGATVEVVKVEGKVLSVMREGGPRKSHGHGGHGGGHDDHDGSGGHDAHAGGHDTHGGHDPHAGGHGTDAHTQEKVHASHAHTDHSTAKKENDADAHTASPPKENHDKDVHAAPTVTAGKSKLHLTSLLRPDSKESTIVHDHMSHAPSGHDDQSHHSTAGPDPKFFEHDHHPLTGPDAAHAEEKKEAHAAKKNVKDAHDPHH
ncbi:MAG: NfeD family protein [Candidatus Altiarchaeia archaeon]